MAIASSTAAAAAASALAELADADADAEAELPDALAAEELLEDEHPAIAKAMTAAMAITTSGLTNFIQIPSLSLNFAFPARTGPYPPIVHMIWGALLRHRIGNGDLVVVPGALLAEDGNVEFLADRRHGDVEPVHFLGRSVLVSHLVS